MQWFGTHWGAGICDDAPCVAVPVGTPCHYCGVPLAADDTGVVMPFCPAPGVVTTVAAHLSCFLPRLGLSLGPAA